MARVTLTVCDICEEGGASTYTIKTEDTSVAVDLCGTHSQPLQELVKAGRGTQVPRGAQRRPQTPSRPQKQASRPSRIKVSTMDEVKDQIFREPTA